MVHCPAAQAAENLRPPRRLVSRRDPALCGSSGTAVVCRSAAGKPLLPRRVKALGDPALHPITGNSFCFLLRSGHSPSVTGLQQAGLWDQPQPGRAVGERFLLFPTLSESGEIRSRRLRPVVSSDRRIAVEIPAVRSSCDHAENQGRAVFNCPMLDVANPRPALNFRRSSPENPQSYSALSSSEGLILPSLRSDQAR